MSRSLEAALVPVVLALDNRIGLALWAPPWISPEGDEAEGFLGERDRIFAFASAAELSDYLAGHPDSDLSDHPAWNATRRRSADELRAEPDAVADFEDAFRILTGEPTLESCAALARTVQIAGAIAAACDDRELCSVLERQPYQVAVYGAASYSGKVGQRNWEDLSEEVSRSWAWVLDRLETRIAWRGDTRQADPSALRKPGVTASPWLGAAPAAPAGYASPPGYRALEDELPSRLPTVLVTLLFGIFGLIPAAIATSEARRWGVRTGRYWAAFLWCFLIEIAAVILLLVVLLSAVGAAAS